MGPPGIVPGIMTPGYPKTTWDSSWQYWTCVSHQYSLTNPHSTSVEKPGEHAGCVLETN